MYAISKGDTSKIIFVFCAVVFTSGCFIGQRCVFNIFSFSILLPNFAGWLRHTRRSLALAKDRQLIASISRNKHDGSGTAKAVTLLFLLEPRAC